MIACAWLRRLTPLPHAQALHASEKYAHATRLPDELAHLKEAGKIKLADVRGALQKLIGEAKELQSSANASAGDTRDGDNGDPFTVVMQKFAGFANAEVQRLRDLIDHVDRRACPCVTMVHNPVRKWPRV